MAECENLCAWLCSGTEIGKSIVWLPCSGTRACYFRAMLGVPEQRRARYRPCSSHEDSRFPSLPLRVAGMLLVSFRFV